MSSITLCNQALAEVASPSIASFTDDSVEASEIARVRLQILAELLDWTEWPWSEVRAVLAATVNDRPAEWRFAYALPADCLKPIAVREPGEALVHAPLTGPMTFPAADAMPLRFAVAGRSLYTNVETATLIYHRQGDYELPPLVARAYVLELAARIAYPLKKDRKLAREIAQEAAVARSIAVADERNKAPAMQPRYVSDAEYARAGFEQTI